jgi:hypothetical protein
VPLYAAYVSAPSPDQGLQTQQHPGVLSKLSGEGITVQRHIHLDFEGPAYRNLAASTQVNISAMGNRIILDVMQRYLHLLE